MKLYITFVLASLFILSSCNSNTYEDPYLITKNSIGQLTDSTQVSAIEMIFKNDSVVKFQKSNAAFGNLNSIELFEKGGEKLLDLSPRFPSDSTSTISTVRILDERFATKKGITINSTFGDIEEAYKISKISNLFKVLVVSVNAINASFTIDKSELPENMRYDMDLQIEAIQIPDNAKIKYFMIHW